MTVEESIQEALNTYKERSSRFGNTWDDVGAITKILYPEGVILHTKKQFAQFHIIQWLIGKLVRYARTEDPDSIKDAGVYAFILRSMCDE